MATLKELKMPRNHQSLFNNSCEQKYILHLFRDERKDLPEDLRSFFGFIVDCYMCGITHRYIGVGTRTVPVALYSAKRKEALKMTLEEAEEWQESFRLTEDSKLVTCEIVEC